MCGGNISARDANGNGVNSARPSVPQVTVGNDGCRD
jgi:hypothetical protein